MCCHATSSSVGKEKQFSENSGTASETATSTVRSGEVEQFEDIARNWAL